MSTIHHKRLEFGDKLEHNIRNVRNYVMMLLSFGETLREDRVDGQNLMRVPKDLSDE